MLSAWFSPSFALEAQEVVWLRTLKMMKGGPDAALEAIDMVTEKLEAAHRGAGRLLLGCTPDSVANDYRSCVRANITRLTQPSQ
jgi:hypothetical protein